MDTKHLKNAKINNANLYYNFSQRFSRTYFSTGGACAPSSPPVESPMVAVLLYIAMLLASAGAGACCMLLQDHVLVLLQDADI